MRRPFADWLPETFVCSFEQHLAPAATVARLRPEDGGLGVELPDGRRLVRCVRCDVWLQTTPEHPASETLPPLDELDIPKRGRALRDSLILKAIAIDRGLHAIVFTSFAILLFYVDRHLGGAKTSATALLRALESVIGDTGQGTSHNFVVRELQRFLNLNSSTLAILIGTAVLYAVVESIEAVGLWRERRWAEYLTAIATAGFLPFEIKALIDRVTVLRVATLLINLAILFWLVWRKRLFGVRGGVESDAEIDREQVFGPPRPIHGEVGPPPESRLAGREELTPAAPVSPPARSPSA
jgi:uncharacterized membrane protein (DUF2068 family)